MFLVTDFTGNGLKFHVPLLKSRFLAERLEFLLETEKISVLTIGQKDELNSKKIS